MSLITTRRCYYALALVATVGLAIMYAVSPMQGDDYWYLMTASSAATPWEAMADVWHECQRHWTFDTGRLANLINPPFLTVVPKWVYAILCGVAVAIVLHCSRWLANASARSMRAYMIVVGVVVALPWSDYMFSVVFSLNYLWTSALVLIALRMILKTDEGRHLSPALFGFALLLCLAAGWMHEGFSVPLLGGLASYFLMLRRRPQGQSVWLVAAFAAGALLIACSPGLWGRTGSASAGFGRHAVWEAWLSGVVFNCLYYVFVLFSLIVLLSRHKRDRINRYPTDMARLVMLLTATTLSTLLFLFFYGGSRMGWFGQLFSGIGIIYLCRFYKSHLRHRWKRFFIALIFVGVTAHLGYSVAVQQRLSREFDEIRELYRRSADGVVYYDVTAPRIDASLLKPSYRQFNEAFPLQQFSYYFGPDKPDLLLLPTALRTVRTEAASLTVDSRLIIYKGNILATDTLMTDNPTIAVRLSGGLWVTTRTRSEKFADSTGHPYTLLVPHLRMLSPDLVIENARRIGAD